MSEPKPMPSYWSLYQEVTHLNGYTDKLRAENAKLRELCRCLFEWERVGGTSRDWRELQDCARELGVDA